MTLDIRVHPLPSAAVLAALPWGHAAITFVVKETKQYQNKWLQYVQRMDTNDYQNKHYNINQKDEGT